MLLIKFTSKDPLKMRPFHQKIEITMRNFVKASLLNRAVGCLNSSTDTQIISPYVNSFKAKTDFSCYSLIQKVK